MTRHTITCHDCGETFETRENWLYDHETCPECFDFPDVGERETPRWDTFDVYMVARRQWPNKSGVEEEYFRVAARGESEALWFTEAYVELEYDGDHSRLASLVVDDGRANTRMKPALTATPVPNVPHSGYTVRKLAFHNGDDADQHRYGPNTTDQFNNMSAEDYQDVLVHTTEEQIDHKRRENVPDGHQCYWTVSGTPRQTRFGQRIWFETDGRIVAMGVIQAVENGRIWFSPLEDVDMEPPTDPPTRGFTYIEDSLSLDAGTGEAC